MLRRAKTENIRAWRSADVDDLELRLGTDVTEPYPRHWHEEYSLCLHTRGGGILEYLGAGHAAGEGTLFVVQPGEVHANRTDDRGCSFRSLYVPVDRVRRIVGDLGMSRGLPCFPWPLTTDGTIVRLFLALHRTLEAGGARLGAESQLATLFARLLERHAESRVAAATVGRERDAVRRAREHLDAAIAENVSLEDLARVAGLSPFHLARVFRAEVGMPPHAYHTGVRILRAKRLLRAGHSLAQVAAATGFSDQSHFAHHFKWLVKVTPGRYLAASKKLQDRRAAIG